MSVEFPFKQLYALDGRPLPIMAVSAFFRSDKDKAQFMQYKDQGMLMIGVTSYKSFPALIDVDRIATAPYPGMRIVEHYVEDKYHLTDTFDYIKNTAAWLYCFSNLKYVSIFPPETPKLEMAESDFRDVVRYRGDVQYDFLYICLKDNHGCPDSGWQADARNWQLFKKLLPIMVHQYGLKGLIVGRVNCGLEAQYGDRVTVTDLIPYADFQERIKTVSFLFVPNVNDASPRVITECLTKGIPVLLNRWILGGKKYINAATGVLFTDERDFEPALRKTLTLARDPATANRIQAWWENNYGVKRSAIRLAQFLRTVSPVHVPPCVEGVRFHT